MTGIRQYVAVLCALLVAAPAGGFAADPPQSQPGQPGAGVAPVAAIRLDATAGPAIDALRRQSPRAAANPGR